MKILHTSDIHIDSPMTARLPSAKIRERRRELIANFAELAACAVREGAGAVIIAGDLFDSERVSRKARDSVLDTIIRNPSLTFFYLKGNHEGDALAESGVVLPENLLVFGDTWTYFTADGITVAGRAVCTSDMFDTLELPDNTKNIIVLHGELRDRSAHPDIIGQADALGKKIDYMALGHYHSYTAVRLDARTSAVYSGTPEGRGFDETGEHGYVIIDTDGTLGYKFRSFAKRQLRTPLLPLDNIMTQGELYERSELLLRDIPYGDLVRLCLVGEYEPELWLDTDALTKRFENRFYHFEVKNTSKIKIDPENYKYDKSFKGEFIRTVSSDESLDDDKKSKIIACGLYALLGENIYDN